MNYSDHKLIKLCSVCSFQEGYVNPSQKVPSYFDGCVKWIRANDINNTLVYDTSRKLSLTGFASAGKSAKMFEPNTLVITKSGTIGRVGILKDYMCGNRATINIIPDNTVVDSLFIFYMLLNQNSIIQELAVGSVQKNLYISALGEIAIWYPPLPEQRAIAATLSCLDDKIELNNRMNKTLEEMAQAIFKSWFVDFEPFQDGEFVDSELGRIPKGWRLMAFPDMFNYQEGPGIRNWQYVTESGVKFLNIRCIKDGDLSLETANMISNDEAFGKYSHFLLAEGDIVISTSGTLGRYAIVRKENLPLCLNTSIMRFTPNRANSDYAFMIGYLTSSVFLEHLLTKSTGSVQANFGPMHIRQIMIVTPPEEVSEEFHRIVNPLIAKRNEYFSENQSLKIIRDTLLSKLMSGEIRVPLEVQDGIS